MLRHLQGGHSHEIHPIAMETSERTLDSTLLEFTLTAEMDLSLCF